MGAARRALGIASVAFGTLAIASAQAARPPGGVIVFDHCASHGQAITGLCSIKPNGTDLRQLTHTGETNPSLSGDGRSIAFNCGIYSRVQGGICIRTGKKVRALTKTGADPSWSPNGKEIVFDSCQKGGVDGGICVIDVRTHAVTRLTSSSNDELPRWSPAAARILFVIAVPFDQSSGVYVMSVRHGHPKQLVSVVAFDASWSPRGTEIVYDHGYDGAWVMNADGSGPHQLVASTDNFTHPSWSPGGHTIVGILNDRLNLVPAGGGQPRRLSRTAAADPDWGA
jgi:Tol biopolymer transport system component